MPDGPLPEPVDDDAAAPYVSTGVLPRPDEVARLVAEAHDRYDAVDAGELSRVYPALGQVSPSLFGVCVANTTGATVAAGDVDVPFTIMSVAKPFVFALACDHLGPDRVAERVGVNATGLAFNDPEAVERGPGGRTNPMVNPGAIATTALVPGDTPERRWAQIVEGLSAFAGHELELDGEVYESASATNHRNRELVAALERHGRIAGDPAVALDLYTRQSCLRVTARDLAVMGATLADGGVHPVTGRRVVDEDSCRSALVVMATAGLYETTGDWLYDIGLPAKSGIGGGIVTVSPGKGGLGTFSPLLDDAGNSVRGQLAARFLSRRLGLDLFRSAPAV